MIEHYFKFGCSNALRKFRTHFKIKPHVLLPNRRTIYRWIAKFKKIGSTARQQRKISLSKVRTPENIEKVKVAVNRSPMSSATKHAQALGFSDRTVRRILHSDLNLRPYKMAVVQELHERDHAKNYQFPRFCIL